MRRRYQTASFRIILYSRGILCDSIRMQDIDFSGAWHFQYVSPTSDDKSEETSSYEMSAHAKGNEVVFESVRPDKGDSYMIVRLTLEGGLATGTWHETTATTGDFKGMTYSGAGQMLISADGKQLQGLWAGAGIDHSTEEPKIYTGTWELTRAD